MNVQSTWSQLINTTSPRTSAAKWSCHSEGSSTSGQQVGDRPVVCCLWTVEPGLLQQWKHLRSLAGNFPVCSDRLASLAMAGMNTWADDFSNKRGRTSSGDDLGGNNHRHDWTCGEHWFPAPKVGEAAADPAAHSDTPAWHPSYLYTAVVYHTFRNHCLLTVPV